MNFHISNLEFACGASLKQVSALHWDQNEDYPQFSGDNLVLQEGFSQVLSRLADGLDIELNTKVTCTSFIKIIIAYLFIFQPFRICLEVHVWCTVLDDIFDTFNTTNRSLLSDKEETDPAGFIQGCCIPFCHTV